MKKQIEGFILYRDDAFSDDGKFSFFPFEMKESGHITVMPYAIDVDIPDDFDPRGKQVEMLQAEKIKLMADFQNRVTEIERKISELTCLEAA
jgi:hypothetical protein